MEGVQPELKNFIASFCKNNKIRNRLSNIKLSTSIDLDLNIFDISMDLFLTSFIQEFKIDYSKFNWDNHGGYPKDSSLIAFIRFMFGYKWDLSGKIILNFYQPKLFISDLQSAIITKELI
jgi:hypothetical protein